MASPRGRDFYKELAGSIRAERVRQQEAREAVEAEIRALEGRLHRLRMWEEICKQVERLKMWERDASDSHYMRK